MTRTDRLRPAALIGLLAVVGCGTEEKRVPLAKVSGLVFAADGKPAAGASVAFHPVGHGPYPFTPFGTVGKDGAFALTSYAAGDGAPAGKYAVTVVWRASDPNGEAMGPDKLKGKGFNDPKTTPLKATVGPADTTLEPFHLK